MHYITFTIESASSLHASCSQEQSSSTMLDTVCASATAGYPRILMFPHHTQSKIARRTRQTHPDSHASSPTRKSWNQGRPQHRRFLTPSYKSTLRYRVRLPQLRCLSFQRLQIRRPHLTGYASRRTSCTYPAAAITIPYNPPCYQSMPMQTQNHRIT